MGGETIWWVILGGMIVTYLTRLSFIVIIPADQLPSSLRRALRFAPPAVLAAIAVPEILMPADTTLPDLTSPQAIAGIIAALVAWRSGSTWLTIAAGMLALWLAQWLGL